MTMLANVTAEHGDGQRLLPAGRGPPRTALTDPQPLVEIPEAAVRKLKR